MNNLKISLNYIPCWGISECTTHFPYPWPILTLSDIVTVVVAMDKHRVKKSCDVAHIDVILGGA